MNEPNQREEAIFEAALSLPPEQRAPYLNKACGDDADLRQRVEALLQAHAQTTGLLEGPAPTVSKSTIVLNLPVAEKPGDRIGRYKLLQQIGEGGCGVVYMAEQQEPVKRRVALKVIKPGMDTRQVLARFEAERQALALMNHPNIAKVLDAGATETGRPYFVMELVRGVRITDYCDDPQNSLPTEKRLELFIHVCRAVQHAHQKGIIHRDIKPSNILVTLQEDGSPMPKVIDFGIAKATAGQTLTDKTLFTAFEQFIGTPSYMSPEQAQLTAIDIDTRSDIYSLGVLLYELLVGRTPFDVQRLLAAGLDEIRRVIREEEPPRPSTRLSKLEASEQTTVAKRRQSDSAKLTHLLRGDLDWIVMKCLEKDRSRRYETPTGLVTDIQRHLNNEPVLARPPSQLYRLQKMLRRNRLAFAAGTAVVLALVFGFGAAALMYINENLAKQRAVEAEQAQRRLREQAEAAERKASTESVRSQQVSQFLKQMLKGVAPEVAKGRDTTLMRELLATTANRIKTDLNGEMEVQADLQQTIGETYYAVAQFEEGEKLLRDALKVRCRLLQETNLAVAENLNSLAILLNDRGGCEEAEKLLRQAIKIQQSLSATNTSLMVCTLNSLQFALMWKPTRAAQDAVTVGREAVAVARKLPKASSDDLANALLGLSDVLSDRWVAERDKRWRSDLDEAETLAREAITIKTELYGLSSLHVLQAKQGLAKILLYKSRFEEAEAIDREVLSAEGKIYPPEHPTMALSLYNLGTVLGSSGHYEEAIQLCKRAVAIRKRTNGYRAGESILEIGNLAHLLLRAGRANEADELYRDLVPLEGETDPNNYGLLLFRAQYYAQSRRFHEAAQDLIKAMKIDPDDDFTRLRLATLLIADRDVRGYEAARLSILEHFQTIKHQSQGTTLAKACLLLPASGDVLRRATAIANGVIDAAATNARAGFIKSLVEYRNERFADSITSNQDAIRKAGPSHNAAALCVLAMAQFKKGDRDASGTTFTQACQIALNQITPLFPSAVFGGDYDEVIAAEIFIREAELLLGKRSFRTNAVTFLVDMSTQILAGRFNPSRHIVDVRGDFNRWTQGRNICSADPDTAKKNIYSATVTMVSCADLRQPFKFAFYAPDTPNQSVWESPAPPTEKGNRFFIPPETGSTNVPVVYFSDLPPGSVTLKDCRVTFVVIIPKPTGTDGHLITTSDCVYLNGDCLAGGWWTWGSPPSRYQMMNDARGTSTYSLTIELPAGSPLRLTYKYSLNGTDNEASYGQDHVRWLRPADAAEYVLPAGTFGVP